MRQFACRSVAQALVLVATLGRAPASLRAAAPVPVIFDTDICGDCDDVAALAMLHALESREQCRLIAVTVSANHPLAAPFVDCLNRFYGRDDVPVGVQRRRPSKRSRLKKRLMKSRYSTSAPVTARLPALAYPELAWMERSFWVS